MIIDTFNKLMANEEQKISQKMFMTNMEKKLQDPDFGGDVRGLLRIDTFFLIEEAWKVVSARLIALL